ncbi:MAG: flagellar biosynthesis anti-sigma factor FlgM [Planctomycetota bacterium]
MIAMPNLNQIGDAAAPSRVEFVRQQRSAAPAQNDPAARNVERSDQVELSSIARSLQDPQIRTDLVQRIRAEIESGSYETPQRLDQAAEALAREISQ